MKGISHMVKKRSNNSGTVYKDTKRGGYRAQLFLEDGRRLSKRFSGLDEAIEQQANDWLTEQLYKISKGQFINPTGLTLGEWLVDWLQTYSKQNVRQRTYERYLSLANHCSPLADYRLQDLKPNHFQKLYVSLDQYSGETRKKVHNLLHAALDQAVHDQLIPYNPITSVKAPKVIREEVITFQKDEIETLLSMAKPHRWYPPLLLATHTGMRLGEILGLRWMDVDFSAKTVYVRQTLQHPSTGIIFEPPKSKASKRKISIPEDTINVLKEYRKKLLEKSFGTGMSDLCFTAENGSPIQPKNFERWWKELQIKCNAEWQALEVKRKALLAQKVDIKSKAYQNIVEEQKETQKAHHKKFHTLRHTHATELLASGENVIDVARRLGHSKPSTTMDIYGHSIPGNDQKIADKVGKLYNLQIEKSQSS